MSEKTFALKGDICYSKSPGELRILRRGYVLFRGGLCLGAFDSPPAEFGEITVKDYGDSLIIPGLVDLHTHAPQFVCRAKGLDRELLEWLESTAFPQEARYGELSYAEAAYKHFVADVVNGPNTRMCLFGTLHVPATKALMDMLEESGLVSFVGKVNMDRNAPAYLCESSAGESGDATVAWIKETLGRYRNVSPILTPRFIPSCSEELLGRLGSLQKGYALPVQSHLSENLSEIEWVKQLHPDCSCYGAVYDKYGLLPEGGRTIMAHCVHCPEEELRLLKDRDVFIAHCAQSNVNLSSGLVPLRSYLDRGMKVGLGSDVAGGYTTSILRAMADTIQMSKMYQCCGHPEEKPVTLKEVFHLATAGGGAFFGRVGRFERDYEFDAVVIDDSTYNPLIELSMEERLERAMYLSEGSHIVQKYVRGREIK